MNLTWPIIFKTKDDNELVYLNSQQSFEDFAAQEILPPTSDDQLIDTNGCVFHLITPIQSSTNDLNWRYHNTLALHQVTRLIQQHHSQGSECCVAKLGFRTIDQAIRSLR